MKRTKKENLPKRSYAEVMADLEKATTPKEFRAIHKELKRDHNSRLFLFQRYPHLSIVIMFITLFVNMAWLTFLLIILMH